MKQDGVDYTTLIYSYDSNNNIGVWAHPHGNLVASYANGVVTMSSDPTNPNGPTPEFSFTESDAFAAAGGGGINPLSNNTGSSSGSGTRRNFTNFW